MPPPHKGTRRMPLIYMERKAVLLAGLRQSSPASSLTLLVVRPEVRAFSILGKDAFQAKEYQRSSRGNFLAPVEKKGGSPRGDCRRWLQYAGES